MPQYQANYHNCFNVQQLHIRGHKLISKNSNSTNSNDIRYALQSHVNSG